MVALHIQSIQIALDILSPETTISPGVDTYDGNSSLVAPAAHGVGTNVQKFRYLFDGQQIVWQFALGHTFTSFQLTQAKHNSLF
jgi:hypothetical protein